MSTTSYPEEVIDLILLNLSKYDLLNSRLVSKLWNQLCLKILNKSATYRQKLCHDFGDYIRFVSSQQQFPQFVLPFELTLYTRTHETAIVKSHVKKLIELFGLECIFELNVIIPYLSSFDPIHDQIQGLITLVDQISQGLQTLNLYMYECNDSVQNALVAAYNHIHLPRVKKISIVTCTPYEINIKFPCQFCEKCPKLEELEIRAELSLNDAQVVDGTSDTFPWVKIQSVKLINVKKESFVRSLHNSSLHCYRFILRNLELSVSLDDFNVPEHEVIEIINIFAASVETLRLLFRYPKWFTPIAMTFPAVLPKLTHLGLIFDETFLTIPLKLEVDSSSFPELKSIELTHHLHFGTNSMLPLPKVNFLTVRVNKDISEEKDLKPYQNHIEELQQIFPALTKICVQSACTDKEEEKKERDKTVKRVLNGVVTSAGAEKITEIILKDCTHNFLVDILHLVQNPPSITFRNILENQFDFSVIRKAFQIMTSSLDIEIFEKEEEGSDGQRRRIIQGIPLQQYCGNNLKNVSKVRLIRSQKDVQEGGRILERKGNTEEKALHLDILVKHLPALKEFEISASYFGSDVTRRTKLLHDIQGKCSDLVINVT